MSKIRATQSGFDKRVLEQSNHLVQNHFAKGLKQKYLEINTSMMKQQDQWIILIVIFLIVLHLMIMVFGYKTPHLAFLIPLLNLLCGLSILLYWVQKQFRMTQHIFEWREISVLSFEMLVVGLSLYALMSKAEYSWLRLLHHVFWGLHFLCLLALLVFMLTFKMKRLI